MFICISICDNWVNLNVVIYPHGMHVRNIQLRLLHEIIDKIHDIVLNNRMKVREVIKATGISHGTVISILHEQLTMKKLDKSSMPHLLTVDHTRSCDDFKTMFGDVLTLSR